MPHKCLHKMPAACAYTGPPPLIMNMDLSDKKSGALEGILVVPTSKESSTALLQVSGNTSKRSLFRSLLYWFITFVALYQLSKSRRVEVPVNVPSPKVRTSPDDLCIRAAIVTRPSSPGRS